MKTPFSRTADSPWLLLLCLLLYIGFIGPQLISATNTLAVVIGLILFCLLAAWSYRFLRRRSRYQRLSHKE